MKFDVTEKEAQVLKAALTHFIAAKTPKKAKKLNEHDFYNREHSQMLAIILFGKLTKNKEAIAHFMNPLQKPKQ